MYGSHAAFAALGERGAGPNHFWIPAQQPVYKVRNACGGSSPWSKAQGPIKGNPKPQDGQINFYGYLSFMTEAS